MSSNRDIQYVSLMNNNRELSHTSRIREPNLRNSVVSLMSSRELSLMRRNRELSPMSRTGSYLRGAGTGNYFYLP
jgi:hypothetical protein